MMQPSEACAEFIESFEKFRAIAYMPTPDDRPTVGYGTTGPDVHLGMPAVTEAWAKARFLQDLGRFAGGVYTCLHRVPTQAEFDAMVSLTYNIGLKGFAHSTVLARFNEGNSAGAAQAFAMWNKQAGKVLAGLTRRRANEAKMFLGQPYDLG